MTRWTLSHRGTQRFKHGHPWVFSNELEHSPKGHEPGQLVELFDESGTRVAIGYGNPQSLIAFRVLERSGQGEFSAEEYLRKALREAFVFRENLGLTRSSFRWIFAEADGLPGVIIDYFMGKDRQTVVIAFSTAGAEQNFSQLMASTILDFVERMSSEKRLPFDRAATQIITRRDSSFRKLEGLSEAPPEVLQPHGQSELQVRTVEGAPLSLQTDFIDGQKTGFFLDQVDNIHLLQKLLGSSSLPSKIRILDLCCYVGQWSAQLASFLNRDSIKVECHLVDASEDALTKAQANVEGQGARAVSWNMNVLKDWNQLSESDFDVVIVDPPAFAKGKKDLEKALFAYQSLNRKAWQKLSPRGFLVSCSCSALVTEDLFIGMLARSKKEARWVARGGQSADHPVKHSFPEGKYLKCWIGKS